MRPSLSVVRQRSLSRSISTTSTAKQPLSAAAASLDNIPAELSESITIPRIADIFDVSPRLGDAGREFSMRGQAMSKPKTVSARQDTFAAAPNPFSLPAPKVFEGPARPLGASAVWPRYVSSTSGPHSQSASFATPFAMEEPRMEVFSGPSRINRYQYAKTPGKKSTGSNLSALAFGAATAVGGAVLLAIEQ
ncbi:hypothetical protein VNI00_002892 [Paramarasmius palmivorus]|uniref:Uncharacterized protein n=1 Tax=Paramarasmius palmivorus TaxID=297713 RepID=A0AAW0DV22_9AGAR